MEVIHVAIEPASYQVLLKDGPFEIRLYEPMVIVTCRETDVDRGDGFNRLFSYISGSNQASLRIAMTAPVINYFEDPQSTTSFVMPRQYQLQDLPQPNDPTLQLRELGKRHVAAVIFSGKINSRVIDQKTTELQGWLREKNKITAGNIALARYNPPFIPGFIQRNEIMIEIQAE